MDDKIQYLELRLDDRPRLARFVDVLREETMSHLLKQGDVEQGLEVKVATVEPIDAKHRRFLFDHTDYRLRIAITGSGIDFATDYLRKKAMSVFDIRELGIISRPDPEVEYNFTYCAKGGETAQMKVDVGNAMEKVTELIPDLMVDHDVKNETATKYPRTHFTLRGLQSQVEDSFQHFGYYLNNWSDKCVEEPMHVLRETENTVQVNELDLLIETYGAYKS